jgi:glycosyltransferase involved in cell wall biosynthesis
VTPSDAAGLAAAVERLMDDAALRQAMAEAGRERVLREYDLDQNIPQLSALYEERLSQYLG